jgi:hypothetical protein
LGLQALCPVNAQLNLGPKFVEAEGRVVPLIQEALRDLVEPLVDRLRR